MECRSIALDGPAGAGKSTLARMASNRYGLIYVDTGAIYRCVGLHVLRKKIGSKDEDGVVSLLPEINIEMKHDETKTQRMILNGEDVTDAIRMPDVSAYASDVSAMPPVRGFLLDMQKEMAQKYDVIMDGRDIGTVVLPEAGLKVFLTADLETRAKRRYLELSGKNIDTTFETVKRDMEIRDKNDSERAAAPLKPAVDSVLLDTTHYDLDESVNALCALIDGRFGVTA